MSKQLPKIKKGVSLARRAKDNLETSNSQGTAAKLSAARGWFTLFKKRLRGPDDFDGRGRSVVRLRRKSLWPSYIPAYLGT